MVFWQSPLWQAVTTSIYPMKIHAKPDRLHSIIYESWQLFQQRSSYDIVLTMGARESLAYGMLCAMKGCPSKQIMTEVFIDTPKRGNPLWHLKTTLYGFVAQRAVGILTNSSDEVVTMAQRFGLTQEKLRYVPMHSNIEHPQKSIQNEGFVLSAGRTLRDYALLLKSAPAIRCPIVIICGHKDIRGKHLPGNVTVLKEASIETYFDYLNRCSIVVLPLKPSERSTGQVVLLEALARGKPVVATRTPGTTDLISHGQNGLFIDAGNSQQLSGAVNRLIADAGLASQMGDQAVRDVLHSHTFETHARLKLSAIDSLYKQAMTRQHTIEEVIL
ncbi:MAG: hypothetical protein A2X46_05230 [Lentisphaerae bacterium GWF2_57_35]|nr:MAG: hypothetical protein A2X46_05230 [Lentisphaerae bacterium GWF2_57_35]